MKKIKKLFAVVLCLLVMPCIVMLSGCDLFNSSKKDESKESTNPDVEVNISIDRAWEIYTDAVTKCENNTGDKYDNVKITYTHGSTVGEQIFIEIDGQGVERKTSNTTLPGQGDVLYFINSDDNLGYIYSIQNQFCDNLGSSSDFRLEPSDLRLDSSFVKDNIFSCKVLADGNYEISLLKQYIDSSKTFSFAQVIISSSGQFMHVKVSTGYSSYVDEFEGTLSYNTVLESEIISLINEAKTHIAE